MPTLRLAALIACLAASIWLAPAAEARERRAFIVGVQDYAELTDLTRTQADADGYAAAFGDNLDFEVTRVPGDPSTDAFETAFVTFLDSIAPGDQVVFVFSGHGWSNGTENYLAFADAPKQAPESLLKKKTVPVTAEILEEIRKRNPSLVIAIFDACRDNPFDAGTMAGFDKGLARVDAIDGMIIINSAGPNQKALDRLSNRDPSPYSVFTRTLLPKLQDPDLPLYPAFDAAREEVQLLAASVPHPQRPMITSDVSMHFCFSGNCKTGSAAPALDPDTALFVQVTKGTKGRDPCTGYQGYLDAHPGGQFVDRVQKLFALSCAGPQPVGAPVAARTVTEIAAEEAVAAINDFDTFQDCDDCPKMVALPFGKFQMGSAPYEHDPKEDPGYPLHEVTLGRFAIGITEITFAQYQFCQMEGGCTERAINDRGYGKGNRPVMNVTWQEAKEYTEWLTRMSGTHTYRLPTEAEWEYAARGGRAGMTYYWEGSEIEACKHGNLLDLSSKAKYEWRAEAIQCDDGQPATAPVGSYTPNPWGLYDMFGNMSEWVEDCYIAGYEGAPTDGSARQAPDCKARGVRGGSWNGRNEWARIAIRDSDRPDYPASNMGFRVVAELK